MKTIHNKHNPFGERQRGAALITALVILVALTVIGVSAFKTSNLEELIVGNLRDQQLSFRAAESALSAAEQEIEDFPDAPAPNDSGTTGVFTRDRFGDFAGTAYDASVWIEGTTAVTLSSVHASPLYITQFESFYPDSLEFEARATGQGKWYYRITSRGMGSSANARTLLQENYGKRYR